jgi:hypothetical protein
LGGYEKDRIVGAMIDSDVRPYVLGAAAIGVVLLIASSIVAISSARLQRTGPQPSLPHLIAPVALPTVVPRPPDVEILTFANEHDFVVSTNDLDFSAILAAGAGGPSVVAPVD